MKGKIIVYWISTIVLCAWMVFAAYAYLSRDPRMVEAFGSLGYPVYLMTILATAKVLGVLALLAPRLPRLKEWAYAGFTFTFIGAAWSHLAANQNQMAFMPLIALVLLVISCLSRPVSRRVICATEVVAVEATPPPGTTPRSLGT